MSNSGTTGAISKVPQGDGTLFKDFKATHALPRATENNWFQKAQAQKNPADLAACGVGQLVT